MPLCYVDSTTSLMQDLLRQELYLLSQLCIFGLDLQLRRVPDLLDARYVTAQLEPLLRHSRPQMS